MSAKPGGRRGVTFARIAREWLRLGAIGFGGPPTHISMLRRLCVERNQWMDDHEFNDAIATTNLLPGPASTQLAIYCAWRLRGGVGALVGGVCFIAPGLALIIALAAVFLAHDPATWLLGAAAGAGATVPGIALHAATDLIPSSLARSIEHRSRRRWFLYVGLGIVVEVAAGQFVVLALVAAGALELLLRHSPPLGPRAMFPVALVKGVTLGTLGALSWVALKVGALSYGGGFVIVPLMRHDVVSTYHWMTNAQFLNAVALGQVTPGPIVQTVAVVGYSAAGVAGALLAAFIAFGPSFLFVLGGAGRFERIRANRSADAFLGGAGPCVIGAIGGSALSLATTFVEPWQAGVLAVALLWLYAARRSVVVIIVLGAALGALLALSGAAV